MHDRENEGTVTVHQSFVNLFVLVCTGIFHSVFFLVAFKLTVTEHWKTRHCDHQSADTKIFVSASKLGDCCFFIRIVHEVYVALEDLRIKLDGVFYGVAVLLVLFLFKHVHEGGIINAVHAKGACEVSFHHPECFCKQKGVRNFLGTAVNNFAPEFIWNSVFKFFA